MIYIYIIISYIFYVTYFLCDIYLCVNSQEMFVANWKRSRHRKCSGREMRVVQKWNPNLHGNLSDDHLFFHLASIEPIVSPKRISAPRMFILISVTMKREKSRLFNSRLSRAYFTPMTTHLLYLEMR